MHFWLETPIIDHFLICEHFPVPFPVGKCSESAAYGEVWVDKRHLHTSSKYYSSRVWRERVGYWVLD